MTTLKKDPAPGTTPVDGSTIATDQWNNAVDRLGGESAPTASKAVATDASGNLTTSSTTDTELGYVHGVTSAIQTQLNTKTTSGSIVNADVNAAAAIAYSKLNLAGSIVNADVNVAAAIAYAKLALSGSIVNADVNASAAIAYSKLNLTGGIVNADVNASAAIAYSKLNLGTSIVNADINASAAIAYAKLTLTGSIVNADVNASAAIAYSKLNLTTSIVDGDVSGSAAIAKSKISTSSTWAIGDIPTGSSSSTVCIGNDSRLSDARTPTAHNLLSTSHGDTLAGSVARGDIVYGNSTPAWARLAIGTANKVLHSDGTDISWQALVAADIPNLDASKITAGQLAAARGGTGQDFSASSGLAKVASGTFSVVTAPSGTVVGDTDSQTLTNKTIAGGSNTISGIDDTMIDRTAIFASLRKKRIIILSPVEGGRTEWGVGGVTGTGTHANTLDANGMYLNEATAASNNADAGWQAAATVRRDLNFDLQWRFRVNTTVTRRVWIGAFGSSPAGADTPTTAHIGLRLSTSAGSTQFVISHADGSTQAEANLLASDTSIHTFRLVADASNNQFKYSLDGAALTAINTNIPAATTSLLVFHQIRTLTGSAANFDWWYMWGWADA